MREHESSPYDHFVARLTGEPLPSSVPEPSDTDLPTLLPSPAEVAGAAGPEPQPRIDLSGRVGAAPHFRTTARGTDVLRFPLAVHVDPQTTEWHTVLFFGERAQSLRESLTKGQAVEVIGYVHEREITDRQGNPRTVREIYGAALRNH